jgi:hypothetical protein
VRRWFLDVTGTEMGKGAADKGAMSDPCKLDVVWGMQQWALWLGREEACLVLITLCHRVS